MLEVLLGEMSTRVPAKSVWQVTIVCTTQLSGSFSLWTCPAGAGEMQYHTDAAENHAVERCLSDPPSSPSFLLLLLLLLGATGFSVQGVKQGETWSTTMMDLFLGWKLAVVVDFFPISVGSALRSAHATVLPRDLTSPRLPFGPYGSCSV